LIQKSLFERATPLLEFELDGHCCVVLTGMSIEINTVLEELHLAGDPRKSPTAEKRLHGAE
jgi:hypothetical protein